MLVTELITDLRKLIGDNHPDEPNISDAELTTILKTSANVYSRVKNIIKTETIPYDKTEEYYDSPIDCYRVKSVKLIEQDLEINFIDNSIQFILEELPDVDSGTLKVTYSRYFKPEEIDERELDLYFLCAEAYCYKHMASKTAELIKFSTGEKIVDESGISKKYLELYEIAEKNFKKKVVRAYGKRVNNEMIDLDYYLPYPTLGETP
jgi:hypothetical protein